MTPTVSNFIRVLLPAPLGPMMPTRLIDVRSFKILWIISYLERDSAQLTSIKLGVFRPG